jgi:hypothetical protein
MTEKRQPITISLKNYNEISEKIKNPVNEFSSVEEYVDYALNEILFGDENNELSDSEKNKVREELKILGYI